MARKMASGVAVLAMAAASLHAAAFTAQAAQATLSWTAPTTYTDGSPLTGLSGYKIYMGTAPGSYSQVIKVGTVTSYTVASLSEGTKYYFAATALDAAGNESRYSNETAFATLTTAPPAPSVYTISASAGAGGTITPSGSLALSQGLNQSYAITPASGYQVAAVTVDGASVGAVSSYTFSNIAANHTIAASFTSAVSSTPPAPTSGALTASTTWQNQAFVSQTGAFTANFDVIPSANNIDTVAMLSAVKAAAFSDGAAIVRLDPNGSFTAMKSSTYASDAAVPYQAGKSYHVRMVVNVASHTYDVYVTPAGGSEVRVASAYPFRSTQATVSALANLGVYAGVGSYQLKNFSVTQSQTLSGTTSWQNLAFASQSGTFSAYFDAVPAANNIDAVTALSAVTAQTFGDGAAIVRFDPNGTITAMKSTAYSADLAVPYQAGTSYRIRMVVNVAGHVYDVYATPAGGSEVKIAAAYPFRSTQASITALKNLGVYSGLGSHKVTNFSVAP